MVKLYKNFPPVIAFTGQMGSGKSTALNALWNLLDTDNSFAVGTLKFAQPLYDLQDLIYSHLDLPIPNKDRKLLQWLGTDWGRGIDQNIWINRYVKRVREYQFEAFPGPIHVILTDDLRFENEAQAVKNLGGVIVSMLGPSRIENTGIENHVSESGIPERYIDFYIRNDKDQAYLEANVAALVEILKQRR